MKKTYKTLASSGVIQVSTSRGVRQIYFRPGFVDTALLNDGKNYPLLLNKEDVAREIMDAIRKGNHVRVIDWRYRIITALWRCIPRIIWRHLPLRVKDKKDT